MVETKTVDTLGGTGTGISRWRFQLDNHLGSAVLELDQAGSVISYEEYHPFGSTAFHTAQGGAEVSAKRYRYTGKEKDDETGLYYHGARYYAPWLGRWTAVDPAGLVDGLNLYAYVRNNPTRQTDATGTQCDSSTSSCLPEEEPLLSVSTEEKLQQSNPVLRENDAANEASAVGILAIQEGTAQIPEFDEARFRQELERESIVAKSPESRIARELVAAKRQQDVEFEKQVERERAIQEELPGLGVAIIPVVGSGNESAVRFKHGDVVGGVIFVALAATDVFLVKSLVVGGGKAAAEGTAKIAGDAAAGAADDAAQASARGADDLVEVFRGTGRTAELEAFEESGLLLSDAALTGFREGGSVAAGLSRSDAAFAEAIERVGSLDALIRLQGELGTEFVKRVGVERSLISVTTDPAVARNFAGPFGRVFSAKVPRSELIKQTLETSTESELFLRNAGFGFGF